MNYLKYLNIAHQYDSDHNCVGLLAAIYERELNIDLSPEKNIFNNFKVLNLAEVRSIPISDLSKLNNWIKISLTNIQEFDIIIYTRNNKLSHFAMYVGDNKIIDVVERGRSSIKHLNDFTRKNIYSVIRHKQLVT